MAEIPSFRIIKPTPENKKVETEASIRERMREAILRAKAHPISPERLKELNTKLVEMEEDFLAGKIERDASYLKAEKEMYNEILASSAKAEYISEYKILIEELLKVYPEKDEAERVRISKWLPHENAHMVAAEVTQHEIMGYVIVFVDAPEGSSDAKRHKPACIVMAPGSWGRKELSEKIMAVIKAPEEHEGNLSVNDKKDIEGIEEAEK